MKKFLNFAILLRFNTEEEKENLRLNKKKFGVHWLSAAATDLAKRFFGMIKTCHAAN